MTVRLLALLFLILFCAQLSLACSCGSPGPQACPWLSATNVIFIGTVLDIENPPPDDGGLGDPDYLAIISESTKILPGQKARKSTFTQDEAEPIAVIISNRTSNILFSPTRETILDSSRRSAALPAR